MATWQTLLKHNRILLGDGAMGTMLFEAGLAFGDPPESWNLQHPERVQAIHRGYLDAGAALILTNTFGGSRLRLALHNLGDRVGELNRAGVAVARSAVEASGREALVVGDIGPSGSILEPVGDTPFDQAVAGFAEQARALAEGGVDLFWIETMSDLEEMRAALEGVRQVAPDRPVITTMTFDTKGRTMMGVTPEEAARALSGWGAAAIGGNCGNGPEEILGVLEKMRVVAPEAVLVAKANAGIPEWVGGKTVYRADPRAMAAYAAAAARAGARVVGACCGSTPAHLQAMADAIRD